MNALFKSKYFWLLIIIFGLQIPLSMIEHQIEDRVIQRDTARNAVRKSWTGEQEVMAALLVIPYQQKILIKKEFVANKTTIDDFQWVERRLYITPENLSINANLKNQTLLKGLYEVPVYTADISIESEFDLTSYQILIDKLQMLDSEIRFNELPFYAVGLNDIRGVVGIPKVKTKDNNLQVSPGSNLNFYHNGFNATLSQDLLKGEKVITKDNLTHSKKLKLTNQLTLNGMERLSFLAMARENRVIAQSDWPHPVFEGAFLPTEREISNSGYQAHWNTGVFSTNINAVLEGCYRAECIGLRDSLFGVKHVQSVDIYLQSLRSIKYGILIILVTFCIFVLYEIINKNIKIHPITYALTGAALVIFFLLLIALSEHINFSLAYWIACLACSGLVGYYIGHQTSSSKQAGLIFAALNSLYLILFFIIRSEDHALLSGSILIFLLLTMIMFVTRKIDWYLALKKE